MQTIALSIWPIVTLVLFSKLGPGRGLIWSLLVGYLFLPAGLQFDVPGLPPINKNSVISLSLLLAALVFRSRIWTEPMHQRRLVRFCLIVILGILFLAPIGTYFDNTARLVNGPLVRNGLTWRDVVSTSFLSVIYLVPFFMAIRLLRTVEAQAEFLKALAIMALIYSLPVLFEVRMSPQLSQWVYGYFPHDWLQHIRGGAFRPVVFLTHGLSLGIFLYAGVLAAFVMTRQVSAGHWRMFYICAGIWLLAVLLVSRNLGATMLAVLLVPAVLFLTRRIQLRIAAVIALVFLAFPMIRQADVIPVYEFNDLVGRYSAARAQSLETRLLNEDAMLARALEKPVFGWGGWGRWRIVDEKGRDLTTADGAWIIILGERGWAGYVGRFGLFVLPLFFLGFVHSLRKDITAATTGMALIMAGNLIYLIPNTALSPVGIAMFGALAGFVLAHPQAATKKEDAPPVVRTSRYTRFAPGSSEMPALLRRNHSPRNTRVSRL